MENTSEYNKKVFKSNKSWITGGIIIALIIIISTGIGIYKHEQSNLFYQINTSISKLDSSIASFHRGLAIGEANINPSFASDYQNNFNQIVNNLKASENSILNTNQSKEVLGKQLTKAQYYDYITQFTGAAMSYNKDFKPLINILNNGGSLTSEQAMTMENDIKALQNSNALKEAMNIYNTQGMYMNYEVRSPYQIVQKLNNLDTALQKGAFNSKAHKQNSNQQGSTNEWFVGII